MPNRYDGVDAVHVIQNHHWTGPDLKKPWDYDVTVVLPHLDTPDHLPLLLDLYRAQSVNPFFLILDTGSTPNHFAKVDRLAGPDCEIHRLRMRGTLHPSDPVAMAMDLAMSLCRTQFLFATHTDVFPRNQRLLEKYLALGREHKIAGYEMTERGFPGWEGMVSHTATVIDVEEWDRLGATWSMRRSCSMSGEKHVLPGQGGTGGFPDTETTMNLVFREKGFVPFLTGTEVNYERTIDEDIDHVRSMPSAKQYSAHPEGHYHRMLSTWGVALGEAAERLRLWRRG